MQSETKGSSPLYFWGVTRGDIAGIEFLSNWTDTDNLLWTVSDVTLLFSKIENHGRSTLISPTAKLRVIFSWKLSQMPCGNHAIYHLIKGVSFQRECGATSMREYNKIILASSK